MNVLLVEDELLVRSGMKSIIDWESNSFKLVADVSHGKEALAVLEQEHVDIVITDIRMPVMDGLELIETIREKGIPCEIVVLSSYDDFQYVRQAMKFGVRDYIHKPMMTPDEMIETLKKVADELIKQQSLEQYRQLIVDAADESRQLVLKKVAQKALCGPVALDPKIAEMLDGHYVVNGTFFLGLLSTFDLQRIQEGQQSSASEEAIIQSVRAVWNERTRVEILFFRQVDNWVFFLPVEECDRFNRLINYAVHHFKLEIVYEISDKPCDITHLSDVYHRLCTKLSKRRLKLKQQHELHPFVREALHYIHVHYMQDLSLEKVSTFVHVSPSYLSRLFYRELGETFVHYVTRYRLQKAQALLTQTDKPVYEIAERVGYNNSKYFLKLFKKQFRMTPGEFREIHQNIPPK